MGNVMLSEALEKEHEEIDAGLTHSVAGLRKGEQRLDSLTGAAAALRRHIYMEEEFLFPVLRRGRFVAAVMVMIREHGEFWRSLDEFEDGVKSALPFNEIVAVHERMARILADHNEKEEAILYPAADDVLEEGAQTRLKAFLATGTMPGDWTCQAVRPPAEASRDTPEREN